MKLGTGLHPRHWHWGAWVVAILLVMLVLVFTHRPSGGIAYAAEPNPEPAITTPLADSLLVPPDLESPPPDEGTPFPGRTTDAGSGALTPNGNGYVAEIVDSTFTVGPAEFFALDLPMQQAGARAVHLFGTVTTQGRKDIMVRLFRASDYDRWLKQKSGRKPQAFWTSPRAGHLTVDRDLPAGEPVVLLLDNGYSIRTPKKVTCQLQIRYQRGGTETFDTPGSVAGAPGGASQAPEDDLPPPRSNTEEEMPAPPPPPPSGY